MAEKQHRTRGDYRFPYHRLDTCINVARVIEDAGSGRLRAPDLARHLSLSVNSSSFRMRLVSTRLFGLIQRNGEFYETTPLAKRIVTGSEEERAGGMIEAFRAVPLFEATLSRYDGVQLPPQDKALDTVLEGEFGVKHGEGDRARQLLLGSAAVAGMIQTREGKRWLVASPAQHTAPPHPRPSGETAPPGMTGVTAPQNSTPPPSSQLGWPPIDPQALAEWEPEKLRVYMEGLEKIARALRGEPPASKDGDGVD